ncbi:HigA family addiction module antitoxin [Flammeovirga sp. OC4]|uniref:HigA family addiction module antitoxin n=1 Tax=Flammeovirga sp. OC4 TaxID=1382345 RepID=UPI0005C69765|nr:HigA family addiction module antitoxin [Flammeovirga sp. OC4]
MKATQPIKVSLGEILKEEFITPLDITIDQLSRDTNISISILEALLNNQAKMDKEISSKLSEYFGMSDLFFYNLQDDIDSKVQL